MTLGPNLSHFMYRLGLTPVTGKRGTTHRLRDLLHRLFSTTLRWTYSDEERHCTSGRSYVIVGEHHLWWSPEDPAEKPVWPSRVVLGREFFDEITTSPVPVDLRALRLLRSSPLALDIYCWLTYRLSYLRRPCLIPWESQQFGARYCRLRDFRRKFLGHLSDILQIYPAARLVVNAQGLLLRPSSPHIPKTKLSSTSSTWKVQPCSAASVIAILGCDLPDNPMLEQGLQGDRRAELRSEAQFAKGRSHRARLDLKRLQHLECAQRLAGSARR